MAIVTTAASTSGEARFFRLGFERVISQRQITTLLIQISEAIEAVPAIAHYPAGLGHAAKLLGQLQQADLP